MSSNIIREDKSVNSENFEFVLAQSNYNLSSIFRSKNHNETNPDTPMTSSDKTGTYPTGVSTLAGLKEALKEEKSIGNQYQFKILTPSTNQICDLKDSEINIVASVFAAGNNGNTYPVASGAHPPRLGNQALMSLFSAIELYIDSTLIERIDYPGFAANADYALRYPHSKTSEKVLESNGFISGLENYYCGTLYASETEPAEYSFINYNTERDGVYGFSNSSVAWGKITNPSSSAHTYFRGLISQRIKLSDIFPCISTLPPIFNHSVTVNFTRNSSNRIIASGGTLTTSPVETLLSAFIDFKICSDCYIITDELKKAAINYYSKNIETLFTKCKQITQGFTTTPTANNTTTLNIAVDSAYKNKLAVICIPRANDFQSQSASIPKPFSTSDGWTNTIGQTYDVASAPANSYTYGGLRSISVYTTNGVKLKSFDMSRDGYIKGPIDPKAKIHAINVKQGSNSDSLIANYQDVYQEYLKSREIFGQIAEEGLDYETFIKEYCMFCVPLHCFSIGSGENLRVELVFDDWASGYNPYYENNDTSKKYMSTRVFCLFYSDKILRLMPNQNVELADLFQAKTESDETNEIGQ